MMYTLKLKNATEKDLAKAIEKDGTMPQHH